MLYDVTNDKDYVGFNRATEDIELSPNYIIS